MRAVGVSENDVVGGVVWVRREFCRVDISTDDLMEP